MSFFESALEHQYQQWVMGTYGSFKTTAGKVDFLECKARLSNPPDTSPESRLTQFLRPVREALPVGEMNFNQLLQRDLDDHRVAVELVPYLLTPRREGPAFFPPVVACLLPFNNRLPADHFPLSAEAKPLKDMGLWRATEFGESFRFDLLLEKEGKEHISKLGRLNWNPESTELVIIDGQHRAMALLAIDRTINKRWTGAAEKYKSFYEPMIKRCLDSMDPAERECAFTAVELPVNIIWFPELAAHHSQHKAARKVFVDLNKNARPPSQSRLMLLSDTDLISIFTRELLNQMRPEGAGFPIYGVEYDNPSRDQASSAKWSTLSNITGIFESVRRLICGPDKFFSDMASAFVGRDNETQMRLVLHASLDLKQTLPETISEDRVYSREEIDETNFPASSVPQLVQQFNAGWGRLLSAFFTKALPFSVHAEALKQLKDAWIPNGEPASSLGKEAIFEGVGLYWTIRDSESHWREENQRRGDEGRPSLPRTDVVNAWDVTESKKAEFAKLRAKLYLGSESRASDSNDAFSIFATAACQIGFVLAARAIAKQFAVGFQGIEQFSAALVDAINAALLKRPLIMTRAEKSTLNLLPKLDTPFAVYFRYFWLELLNSHESKQVLKERGFITEFSFLVDTARKQYHSFLVKQFAKRHRDADPDLKEPDAIALAEVEVDKLLKKVLLKHFGITAAIYDQWRKPQPVASVQSPESTGGESLPDVESGTTSEDPNADILEIARVLKGEDQTSPDLKR